MASQKIRRLVACLIGYLFDLLLDWLIAVQLVVRVVIMHMWFIVGWLVVGLVSY